MKSITAKVITISSQLLLVGLFFSFIFYENSNDENITVSNSNFDKMADKTLILFKKEEIIVNSVNNDIIVPFDNKSEENEEIKNDMLEL